MICRDDITNLKEDIDGKICENIIVKGSLGKIMMFKQKATIEKAYPEIFVIKYDSESSSASYSYKDILTKEVEVDVFDGVGYSPLIP